MRNHWCATLVCVLNAVSQAVGQIRGVNLGGWLTTEPWIAPAIYRNTTAADEWDLCNQLGKEACLTTLQAHWSTFYTKDDLQDIKTAGLNTLRIPLGYWAVDLADYEPYVNGQYPYLIQAVQWAQELDLSVMISLHGVPGSQNGYAGSGLIGPILFPSNTSNTDRTLNVLKNLTEEFSQPTYGNTVTSIELMNEPGLFTGLFTMSELQAFYTQGISTVQGVDPNMNVSLSDGFYGPEYWSNWTATQANDHLVIDTHYFYAFAPNVALDRDQILSDICNNSVLLKQSTSSSGVPATVIGEWSLQSGLSSSTESQAWRTWLRLIFEAQIAAYTPSAPGQPILGWIFWAWKTEHDVDTWSYRRGIAEGYIPADATDESLLVYPKLANGCVDTSYNYTAPATVATYVPPSYDNSSAGSGAGSSTSSSSGSSTSTKSGAASVVRSEEVSWALLCAVFAVAWWGL